MTDERRKAPRVPARLEVHVRQMDVFLKEQSKNISSGGIFIQTDKVIPTGTPVQITLYLPVGNRELNILVEGEVARQQFSAPDHPAGLGVEFKSFSLDDQRTLLEDFVARLIEESQN